MYRFIFLILLLTATTAQGQSERHLLETGLAWHGITHSGLEGQIGYGKKLGMSSGTGHYGVLTGVEWQPSSNMVGWSGQLFFSLKLPVSGINFRPTYVLYQRGGRNLPVIRPEGGFAYKLFSVNYGYNIWLTDPVVDAPDHRIILRVQMPFGIGKE